MRWVPLCLLVACGGASEAAGPASSDASSGGEITTAEATIEREPPAIDAVRVLLAFQASPDDTPPAELGAAIETVADAFEEDGSPLVETLKAQGQALREREVSERDVREMVDMAIDSLWRLMHERAERGSHPAACAIGRALALQGFERWRAELSERLQRESLAIDPAEHADARGESPTGCADDDEDCFYRWTAARAHWIAFGDDGALARLQTGLEAGPAETAAAIEAHLDDTRPLFQLLGSPRPQRSQVADLAPLCSE